MRLTNGGASTWLVCGACISALLLPVALGWLRAARMQGRPHRGPFLPLSDLENEIREQLGTHVSAFDTPETISYDRLARVVAGLHGVLRELAGPP